MNARTLLLGTIVLTVTWHLHVPAFGADARPAKADDDQAKARFGNDVVPFLAKHCFSCHAKGKKRGDLALDTYGSELDVQKNRVVWENVLDMIRSGEMPPKGRPRPEMPETEGALQALEHTLAQFDCKGPRNPGRVTLRRLNREEYNNTIRDLVGVDFKPAADFPNDDVGYGFDNIGDVLTLSPLLLEKYLSAAEAILERAVVVADPPKAAKARLEGVNPSFRAGEFRRGVGPVLFARGSFSAQNYFDEGDYVIRLEVYGQQFDDEPARASLRINGTEVEEFMVRADRKNPTEIEAKVHLKAGTNRFAVTFLNPYSDPDLKAPAKYRRLLVLRGITTDGPYNPPPPVLPETHQRIMASGKGLPPRQAAHEIITQFASRAFRRPVRAAEVERFIRLYDRAEKEGQRFEERIRLALEGVLISPAFLFRVELDPPGAKPATSYAVDEYALASRLSYFLWSSMPDAELLALAAEGRLRANLEAQARRMLADPKSQAFVRNFAGQWLTLRKLADAAPDPKEFPSFDEELRSSMVRETELFFEAILREDRPILDLLDADFSFVNEKLAKHYGIEGVKGKTFRRVAMPSNRGGVLTQASVLTLTSNPTRTAPVKRGKWVLDQILGTPPPPPPPDVPNLDEQKRLTGSLRKVMEQHRENALCASCHRRMDPIGFAFENYNAIGAWRDRDGEFPVDASGVLPDGRSFRGPGELKAILREKKDVFRRSLTEKMLTYALGRGLEYYDRCAVDQMLEALGSQGDRMSALVIEIVESDPFGMRIASGGEQ